MLLIIIWKPYIERTTIFTIHRKECWIEQKLQAFIQSSFLTEAMNNQTTAKMKSYCKTVLFEVWFCSEENNSSVDLEVYWCSATSTGDALQPQAKHSPAAYQVGIQCSASQYSLLWNGHNGSQPCYTPCPCYPRLQGELSCLRNHSTTDGNHGPAHQGK